MKSLAKFFLAATILASSSANADVVYRWLGDNSNPSVPSPIANPSDVRFSISFTDEAVGKGFLSSSNHFDPYCNGTGLCAHYLNDGVTGIHFGIGNNGSWTVDSTLRPGYNYYDINVIFGKDGLLTGSMYIANNETDAVFVSSGTRFM